MLTDLEQVAQELTDYVCCETHVPPDAAERIEQALEEAERCGVEKGLVFAEGVVATEYGPDEAKDTVDEVQQAWLRGRHSAKRRLSWMDVDDVLGAWDE